MYRYLLFLLIALAVVACHPEDNRNSAKFREEMESRKLQRVTEGQLIAFAMRIGKKLLDTTTKSLNPEFLRKVDSAYGITIIDYKAGQIEAKSKLAEIEEAYIYNQSNNIVSEDNLQKQGDTLLIYTRPVVVNSTLSGIYAAFMEKKKLVKKYTDKTIRFEF